MDSQSDFRSSLQSRISASRQSADKIQARIDELLEELARVNARREAAETLYRAEFGEVPPIPTAVHPPRPRRGRRVQRLAFAEAEEGPLTGLTWQDALVKVLADSEPLHVKEIWRRLAEGGFKTDAQDPLRSIVAVSIRNPRIVRDGPNTYALVKGTPSAAGAGSKE